MPTKTAQAKPARPKRGTINKKLIMDTSALMFHEKGYDRTTLEDIASALSITKPSLYYHFANKEEILLACVFSADDYFREEIAQRDDETYSGRKRVEVFLRLYLEVITHDIGVSMILADDRVMTGEGRTRYNELRRTMNDGLEDRIKAGVADGSIKVPETKLTTYAIFGMFNWVGHWHFRKSSTSLEKVFDRFISVIFDGIG